MLLTEEEKATNKATQKHINDVQILLKKIADELFQRGIAHDQSKMEQPELAIFTEYTPKLAESTYGSNEYKQFLREMGSALEHHYKHNRHHPEHFTEEADATFRASPVNCMNLIDIIEMFCDWKAATLRHNDGDLRKSIEINADRFGLSQQLKSILLNTVEFIERR